MIGQLTPGINLQGRYRIVGLLGQGGMSTVYQVHDLSLNHRCVIKENLDTSPGAQQQFQQEAVILANLSHPHLPRVTDHFIVPGGQQYLVMDYVEGEDLEQKLSAVGHPLPESQVLTWAAQVMDALEYLHGQQPPVIHRDVKPANVKITPTGQAMLVDFGIAKRHVPGQPTLTGARAYTPGYAPFEQYMSSGQTDARSDVYALGATLYCLLTGTPPPDAPDRMGGVSLLPPRQRTPALSDRTDRAIRRTLEMDPARRPQTVAEMRAELFAGVPGVRRFPYWLAAVAVVMLLVGGLLGALLAGRSGSGRATPIAVVLFTPAVTSGPPTFTPEPLVPTATPVPPTDTPALPTGTLVPPTITPTIPPLLPQAVETRVWEQDGAVMVKVPAGEFLMGSTDADSEALADEKPQHTVYLDGFWIDQTEVSNARYRKCVEAGECEEPGYWDDSGFNAPEQPVVGVNWHQAKTYCEWAGKRLPTEAEWEKAARGTDGRKYPWGDSAPDCDKAQYSACEGTTVVVGSKPAGASPYGALDMAGNVWEWCQDWYGSDYYAASLPGGPRGPDSGEYRVVRGGSWRPDEGFVRAAFRYWFAPDSRYDFVGFRCVSQAP